jgi:hypothetical protein
MDNSKIQVFQRGVPSSAPCASVGSLCARRARRY